MTLYYYYYQYLISTTATTNIFEVMRIEALEVEEMLSTDSSSMTNNCFGVLDKTSTSKYYILGSENLALILTHLFLLHYAMCFQSNLKPSQCVQAKG